MSNVTEQLIEECANGHNYRAAHNHETCPVPDQNGAVCGAKVVNRYTIKIGSDV